MADEEKTEDPTGKKLSQAKDEGNVAKSKEVPIAATLFIITFFMYFYTPYLFENMGKLLRGIFTISNYTITTQSLHELLMYCTFESIKLMAPILAVIFIINIVANIAQTGFILSPKAMQPKFDRLNPINGFKNLFSKRSLVELIKSLFKIFVVSYVAFAIVKAKMGVVITLSDMDFYDIVKFFGLVIYEIMWKISLLAVLMATLDVVYQRYQHTQDMKMTKNEVKDERKSAEGDPVVKNRIKSMQRELARNRMMENVQNADVVVTNPTHYAVALRYNPGEDRAPIVLAKGQRLVALRIREIAKDARVLVHEDPPIARSLFKTVDIGDEIPENLYKAVAEILSLVDKFRKPRK